MVKFFTSKGEYSEFLPLTDKWCVKVKFLLDKYSTITEYTYKMDFFLICAYSIVSQTSEMNFYYIPGFTPDEKWD